MQPMTLRQRIEKIVTELDEDFFLAGAPISTVASMLRAALAQDAPRVFTTVEELDSEEAAKVLGLMAPDNTGLVVHWYRVRDRNMWVRPGVAGVCSSDDLLADTDDSYPGGFTVVPRPDAPGESALAPAPLPALVTPCHGSPLWVSTRSESYFGGYGSTEVVDDISCDAPGCLNTWDRDGTLLYQTPVD
jgi:hypothetical protein